MSWHFSQVLVEEYLEENSLDGELSVPLKSNLIAGKCSCAGKTKGTCRLSRYGMTCEPLTESRGEDLLTWFQVVFLAKIYPQQERVQESMESEADFGLSLRESFAMYDRNSHSWKTPQCSFLEGLGEYSETWPKWGIMRNGVCWEQTMLEHRTGAKESGLLLPTPTVNGNYNRKGSSMKAGDGLATVVRYWPMHCLPGNGGSNGKKKLNYPTPTASEHKFRLKGESQQSLCSLAVGVG